MPRFLLVIFMLTACGSSSSKNSDTSSDSSGSGISCSLGSDCTINEFCFFDYRDGNSPDSGNCVALPQACEGPTSCADCPELQDAVCPESFTTGCSDSSADDNPIFSCN